MSQPSISISPRMSTGHVEKFEKSSIQCQSQNGNGTVSKKMVKQQLLANQHNVKRKYSQSKHNVDHESSEDKEFEEPATNPSNFRSRSKTISDTSGEWNLYFSNQFYDLDVKKCFELICLLRSIRQGVAGTVLITGDVKVEMESGTKSEGEEDSQAYINEKKTTLGRTPNHLTLSTTSTISAGSTGSQARLIQSSHQPENYQPITVKELGKKYVRSQYREDNKF